MSFILYNFLLWIFSPFLLLFLIYRTWKRKDSLVGIYERFGFHDFESKTSRRKKIWIHAVSVGEVNATKPILNILLKLPNILNIYLKLHNILNILLKLHNILFKLTYVLN